MTRDIDYNALQCNAKTRDDMIAHIRAVGTAMASMADQLVPECFPMTIMGSFKIEIAPSNDKITTFQVSYDAIPTKESSEVSHDDAL